MTVEQVQGQGPAHGVADQAGLLQTEAVQQIELLVYPDVQPGRRSLRWVVGMIALAVADEVWRQAIEPLAQSWQGELPVGPGGGTGPGALQKEDGLVVPLPRPVEVRLVRAGPDVGIHGFGHASPFSLAQLSRRASATCASARTPRLPSLWPR